MDLSQRENQMRIALCCSLLLLWLASACSYQTHLSTGYVASHPRSFRSDVLREKKLILVVDEELKTYRVTRPVYDWLTGHPHDLSFDLGPAFSVEISRMCDQLFLSVDEISDLKKVNKISAESAVAVVLPKIVRAEVFFPSTRLGRITAEVTAVYSFYGPTGNLNGEEAVTGRGEIKLLIARRDYRLALEAALHELMKKSSTLFQQLLTRPQ